MSKEEFDRNNLLEESFMGARDIILNEIKDACAVGECHILTQTGICDKTRICDYMAMNTGVTRIMLLKCLKDSTPDHLLFSWCDNEKMCSSQKNSCKRFYVSKIREE